MAPVPDAAASQLPKTYKRLVGRHVGERFRDVCEEEVVEVQPPGDGEVRRQEHLLCWLYSLLCWHGRLRPSPRRCW